LIGFIALIALIELIALIGLIGLMALIAFVGGDCVSSDSSVDYVYRVNSVGSVDCGLGGMFLLLPTPYTLHPTPCLFYTLRPTPFNSI